MPPSTAKASRPDKNAAWKRTLGRRPGAGLGKGDSEVATVDQDTLPSGINPTDIIWVDPTEIENNPLNKYPPLAEIDPAEWEEFKESIQSLGVLQAILIKVENGRRIAIFGHNRKTAAAEVGLKKIPVQIARGHLTPELEIKIIRDENERRRWGTWSPEEKTDFIERNFGPQVRAAKHGGNREQGSMNLAQEIAMASRNRITEGTAKRLIAEMRKSYAESSQGGDTGAKKTAAPSGELSPPPELVEWASWDGLKPSDQKRIIRALHDLTKYDLPKKIRALKIR